MKGRNKTMPNYKTYEVRVYANGNKEWRQNDQLHREDGPAFEGADGHKEWRQNDQLHREDGPAVETAYGDKEWWLNGRWMTEQEHREAMRPKPEVCNKTVIIDGVEYRLVPAK